MMRLQAYLENEVKEKFMTLEEYKRLKYCICKKFGVSESKFKNFQIYRGYVFYKGLETEAIPLNQLRWECR